MTKKKKAAGKGPWQYLRELSVVIIGVGVTFMGSNMINRGIEKRDTRLYLDAVKLELEQNMELAQSRADYYQRTQKFGEYLHSDKLERLNPDSLEIYSYGIQGNIAAFNYKTGAFDMLKISGTMRLIKDKALMNSILDCYTSLENAKMMNDFYMQRKLLEIYESFLGGDGSAKNFDLREPQYKRLRAFYSTSQDFDYGFSQCAEEIEQTLEKF